jgi:carbonic anhydrase
MQGIGLCSVLPVRKQADNTADSVPRDRLPCADSRVPPVDIIDQGLGDLFVVRVAGNVIGDHALGSIEYAVKHLHTPVVIVMGHASCGAIGAVASGSALEGHIATLGPAIQT